MVNLPFKEFESYFPMKSIGRKSLANQFKHGPFRMFFDASNQKVAVGSRNGFEGFLVKNVENKSVYGQMRMAVDCDDETLIRTQRRWKEFIKRSSSDICPEILGIGHFENRPYVVTELPTGEPIGSFAIRNGALPVEVAVGLVADFVSGILELKESFYRNYAICPQTVWICRTSRQPKIAFGEIGDLVHDDPEAHNQKVCIDLLNFLTGGATKGSEAFRELLRLLSEETQTLSQMEEYLSMFVEKFPAANHWMGYNEPAGIIENVKFPPEGTKIDFENSAIVENARKTIWPILVGASVLVVGFLCFCIFAITVEKPQIVENIRGKFRPEVEAPKKVAQAERERTAAARRRASVQRRKNESAKVVRDPIPVKVASEHRQPVVQPEEYIVIPSQDEIDRLEYEKAIVKSEAEDALVKTPLLTGLFKHTGDLFKNIMTKPKDEWLVFDDQQLASADEAATEVRLTSALRMNELAKQNKINLRQTFNAIQNETILLKFEPDSAEIKDRLATLLTQLASFKLSEPYSKEDKKILIEASSADSKADDLLYRHFRAFPDHK